ncbi:MAG: RHS repeat domain-containing protein, partial [Rickettsiaceae bacterium]
KDNRLNDVTTPTSTISYTYDASGIRQSQTVDGTTTHFLVDPNRSYAQVLEDQNDLFMPQTIYVYGDDLITQSNAQGIHTYHYDGLGSTRVLTDASGIVQNAYGYEAFGEVDYSLGTVENKYLFTGEQYDNNVGFYYLRARFYNPSNGRFVNMDTYAGRMHEPVTLHKYMYTHADPVNNIDPSGNLSLLSVMSGIKERARLGTLSNASARSSLNRFLIGNTKRTTAGGAVSSGNSVGFIGNLVVQEAREALIDTLMDYALSGLDPFKPKSTFGTKAHTKFEHKIKELNKRLNKEKGLLKRWGITIIAEPFFDGESGKYDPNCRRCKGSFGIDVAIMKGNKVLRSFDLKTGGAWTKKESRRRANKVGSNVFQIFVVPKK